MNILMVLTSHNQLGQTGLKTGFWLEELAAPYYVFKQAGAKITLASPLGGQPPLDPKSDDPDAQTEDTIRFKNDVSAMEALANTTPLRDINVNDYDAVFYPGGHGPLWDLAENYYSIKLIESALQAKKPVGAVCHAPGVLKHVQINNEPVVAGRNVTGFSDSEEAAVNLTHVVPFLVEDMLKANGGIYSRGADWTSHVVTDGKLITGQNPASSADTARAVLKLL